MAQYGDDKYGHQMGQTDEYGNPVHHPTAGGGHQMGQTDEYGNPVHHPTAGGYVGAHGADPHHGAPIATGVTTTDPHHRRSGSSSSSSSEDDGQGGRRKKGLKDKIKEKLPGGGQKDSQPQSAAGYGGVAGQPEHEKKGMMEKIKEKLPGGHRS